MISRDLKKKANQKGRDTSFFILHNIKMVMVLQSPVMHAWLTVYHTIITVDTEGNAGVKTCEDKKISEANRDRQLRQTQEPFR